MIITRQFKTEIPPHTFRVAAVRFSAEENRKLKVTLSWDGVCENKECVFCNVYFAQREFFKHFYFISVLMNKLSEFVCFYTSKDITSYCYLFLKFVESRQCSLKVFLKLGLDLFVLWHLKCIPSIL